MTFQRELIPIDLEKNKRDAIAKLEKQKQQPQSCVAMCKGHCVGTDTESNWFWKYS